MKHLAVAAAVALMASAPAFANQALAQAKGCMACHGVDNKLVGPAYKDVAKKYAGNKAAEATLAEKIIKGGAGVWGPVPMPANAAVSPDESKTLVRWILSLK
jgi:cytochrome c